MSVLITVAAVATTVAVTIAGAHATTGASPGGAVLAALARGAIVGVPLAVALYACQRPAHARFGRLLLLVSGLWVLASLSTSSSSLLFSIGRVTGWLGEVGLVYTILVFPGGRLRDAVDRGLMAASVAVATILYLPTALLVERYPDPWAWSSCYHACPHNAFLIAGSQPAFVNGVIEPVRELLTALVFVIVAARLAARIRDANSLMRRILTPVLAVAIARLLAEIAMFATRRSDPTSAATAVAAWTVAFAAPAVALAFLVGLVRWHLFISAGIRKVTAWLREMPGPREVRQLLGDAFDDSALQIASWSSRRNRWIDSSGTPLEEPKADSRRYLSEVRDGSRRAVAILHDAALAEDSGFIAAAAAAASVAFAGDRVAGRTAGLIRELKASRARTVAAADDERRRIERDLHDGAQQQLVALSIHLELAAEKAEGEHPAEARELRALAGEVEQALEQMRTLTRGIHPATLADRGLEEVVQSAARHSPVPTSVEVRGLRDYPPEIVTAVYFCCAEALQNVAKHAHGARSTHIVLREADSALSFSISDDGPGMIVSDTRVGAGLLNMRDRITTVGGKLTVQSRPGEGTRVSGRIPLVAAPRPQVRREEHAPRTRMKGRQRDHIGP